MSSDKVCVWNEKIVIPTYPVGSPDKNPMFLEKRVYQGSSGAVYPLPVIETISDEKKDVEYEAVYLENRYLKIMLLPCFGGRVQMAYDKTNDYHFIYHNRVIKPALVGLTGPWLSGGIEFNWPQHHRPSTYDPVEFVFEDNPDGSKTAWVGEIERLTRTKGMAGFTLYPDKAFLEIKAKLFNRTAEPQTFLWWANPAVAANDDYQSIFPPDVRAVFDHGKRDVSSFPIARGTYYKVDYSAGVDISRFKNIPVPTSYMAAGSKYDFMGGYDHGRQAGMLHYADHHISPGKKQWVWGCGDFGDAWHRNLTDEDGPYVELMTGVFTDNQPDFSWLMPYEEKRFTQYFFPYKGIGAVKNATPEAAVNLELNCHKAYVGVYVTGPRKGIRIELSAEQKACLDETADLDPAEVFEATVALEPHLKPQDMTLKVFDTDGSLLVAYRPQPEQPMEMPRPAEAIGPPEAIANNEALYLAGLHLEQYRHATYRPEPYYREALRRDPGDLRCNTALGLLLYRQGHFVEAETCLRAALERQYRHNPNPIDGYPSYYLGICLRMQGRLDDAYDAFYKSVWNAETQDCGYYALAQIACLRGDRSVALAHLDDALARNSSNHKARHLKIALLRGMGQTEQAKTEAMCAIALDRLDLGVIGERAMLESETNGHMAAKVWLDQRRRMLSNVHNSIEIAIDYGCAGFFDEAIALLREAAAGAGSEKTFAMVYYYLGYYSLQSADYQRTTEYFKKAAATCPEGCFPHRLESILVLNAALEYNPADAHAWYYFGNMWYGKRKYDAAISAWEKSAELDTAFATVHRNLGLAYYNKRQDKDSAYKAYKKAFELDRSDARVLYELDQLRKRLGKSPADRLAFLDENIETVRQRDDLFIEYVTLLNLTGQFESALSLLESRQFHPWEGGEGKVNGAYVTALTEMAKCHLSDGFPEDALSALERTRCYPENLGEGKLYGCLENDIHYYSGLAYDQLERPHDAKQAYQQAAAGKIELSDAMYYNDQPPDKLLYQALALRKLGDPVAANERFERLVDFGRRHLCDTPAIDYFAVSLPDFLIFEEDLNLRNRQHCQYLIGLGCLGRGELAAAREAFDGVLEINPAHAGAVVHRRITANGAGPLMNDDKLSNKP